VAVTVAVAVTGAVTVVAAGPGAFDPGTAD